MPDTIYNNRYRIDAKIGEGGMAVVYRGYDLLLRRQVAIKVLRPQYAADPEFVARFLGEAQAAARLSHPNIVNTYDVGQFDGSQYIVQEFVPGETLATVIARQGRLPEAAVFRYARQICAALAASHREELLHRDIKPSNILVTPEDVVRVTDFGIARAAGTQTLSGSDAMMGSAPYCAPEQVNGAESCEASDLYSLGVVMYEMATGRRPFAADTAVATAMAHLNQPVPDPRATGAEISSELRAVIMKLLQKKPQERYQSAGELLAALRRWESRVADFEPGAAAAGPDSPTTMLRRRAAHQAETVGSGKPYSARAPANGYFGGALTTRRITTVAAISILAIVALALLIAVQKAASHSLRVPELSGKSVAEAIVQLRAVGIDNVAIEQRTSAGTEAGLVNGTVPLAKSVLRPGDRVTLVVSTGPPTVGVPNVLGQDPKVAVAFLSARGFSVRVGNAQHSPKIKPGLVANTNPKPGAPVAEKGTIVVFPSSGPLLIPVPNLVSMKEDDARKLLARLGFKLAINSVMSSIDIPPHVIIDQDPAGGQNVEPGATIVVDTSGGPASVTVPDVVGSTLQDAQRTLAQAGLAVGSVGRVTVSDAPLGTVVSQNPGPNSQAAQGQTVDLVVAAPADAGAPAPGASAPSTNSLGPVPNVIGMSVDEARTVLEKAGFRIDHVTVLPGSAPTNHRVVGIEPEPGATTPPGDPRVNLLLGTPGR